MNWKWQSGCVLLLTLGFLVAVGCVSKKDYLGKVEEREKLSRELRDLRYEYDRLKREKETLNKQVIALQKERAKEDLLSLRQDRIPKAEEAIITEDISSRSRVVWRAPQKSRILIVGVGDFKDSAIPGINNAISDALYLSSFFQSVGLHRSNITCLTNEQAAHNNITDALMKLRMATTEESETAIFYFSGHGVPIVKDGKIVDAVLVPYDAKETSLEYTGIKISTLREMLSDTRGNWVVMLDACFSGKKGRSLMSKGVKGIAIVPEDFNVVPDVEKGSWWITATSVDNFANEFPKANQGLFTYYFVKALNGDRDVDVNEDGLITIREAFSWAKKEVQEVSSKSLGRPQIPELVGQGDIILTIPK